MSIWAEFRISSPVTSPPGEIGSIHREVDMRVNESGTHGWVGPPQASDTISFNQDLHRPAQGSGDAVE